MIHEKKKQSFIKIMFVFVYQIHNNLYILRLFSNSSNAKEKS